MKFIFCPLTAHGYVYPHIGIAKELQRRGHQVAFVTGLPFRQILEAEGLAIIPRGPKDGPSFEVDKWFKPLLVAMQYKHLAYAIEQFQPDALVSHLLSLGSLIIRERLHLPVAVLGMASYLLPRIDPNTPPGETASEDNEGWESWRNADIVRYLDAARALFQLPPTQADPSNTPLLGDAFLLQSVPSFSEEPEKLPPRVHFVGSCGWEPPADPELIRTIQDFASDGLPLVYVHHGRSFHHPGYWPALIEAFSKAPVRIVASVARMERDPGPLPSNFLVRPHIPQGAVLPHARAVICGGNTTAALGALTHGLPMLLFPRGGEQPDVARTAVNTGVGLRMPVDNIDASSLHHALMRLLHESSFSERAAAIAREFQAYPGPKLAADLIERVAQTRAPITRI